MLDQISTGPNSHTKIVFFVPSHYCPHSGHKPTLLSSADNLSACYLIKYNYCSYLCDVGLKGVLFTDNLFSTLQFTLNGLPFEPLKTICKHITRTGVRQCCNYPERITLADPPFRRSGVTPVRLVKLLYTYVKFF